DGALVDGPVYGSIFRSLRGLQLLHADQYAEFQSDFVVYHDDAGDYSTNEPTMDGTASLIYLLAEKEAESPHRKKNAFTVDHGAITRGDRSGKEISLVFTGDEFADGGEFIASSLLKEKIKASFFLTGNFYRNKAFKPLIKKLKNEGHYLGSHSDKHLLYADWTKRDSLLVTHEEFRKDLAASYRELNKFGIDKAPYFLPPYEWYNDSIAAWSREMGLTLVNYSPGTRSNADYTWPEMGKAYISSGTILQSINDYEIQKTLNGFILLVHIGTDPRRKDKFYLKLPELIETLKAKGYQFKRIDELL
ncbi:MAG: polysaccharide deacetylase family protein, partial [Chitinophagaceae bacterium]